MIVKYYRKLPPIEPYGKQYKPRPMHYSKTINRNNLVRELAKEIVDGMRRSPDMPYRTGNLMTNGIKWTATANKATILIGNRQVPYAWYLEFSDYAGRSTTIANSHKGWVEKTVYDYALPYALSYIQMRESTLSPKIKEARIR